jgi:hypothetical protein
MPIISADPSITISDYTLTPSVFMPGDSGILSLTIYNSETTATHTTATTSGSTTTTIVKTRGAVIQNVYLTSANDGDYLVKTDYNYEDLGEIAPAGSITLDFPIDVSAGISEGWYFPILNVDLETSGYQDLAYPISVQVSNDTVELTESNVPSKISIGGSTDLTLTVVNNRDSPVDKVNIYTQNISGIKVNPKNYYIGDLDSDSSEEISFSIEPSEIGKKNLTFVVSFRNGYNLHNSSLTIPIEIINTYDVAPVLYSSPSSVSKGSTPRIRLEVYNAKTEEITGVIVSPMTNGNFSLTPNQYFIGSMDPDDVFSASFEIDTNNLEIGEEYDIDFRVTYKQGENYFETPSVRSSFEIVEPTQSSGGIGISSIIILVLIIIIIIIVLNSAWKKRRTSR